MASVINTNVSSLLSQNSLSKNTGALSTAMERLSTGIRINSAKDDAAGLAISTRMTSEIRGLQVAVRNANDGISVSQTAEGSLGEITNILQRLRELAVQAANASNNDTDRSFLDTEAQQLIAETNRIGSQANFNGIKLLDGSFTAKNFQVGANASETITFNSIADSRATGLGQNVLNSSGSIVKVGGSALAAVKADAAAVVAGVVKNGVDAAAANFTLSSESSKGGGTSAVIDYAINSSAKDIADKINERANSVGITASATNSATLSNFSSFGAMTFKLNGTQINATTTSTSDLTAVAAAINGVSSTTQVTASFEGTDKSKIKLSTTAGENISIHAFTLGTATVKVTPAGGTGDVTLTSGVANTALDSTVVTGEVKIVSSRGRITAANGDAEFLSGASVTSSFTSVSGLSLTTASAANSALSVLDEALTQVNNTRAALGGLMNRFNASVSNQQTTIANLSASRSRILDADYAVETTNLAKAQIIQQAATAMLAQANQAPQSVLALLK